MADNASTRPADDADDEMNQDSWWDDQVKAYTDIQSMHEPEDPGPPEEEGEDEKKKRNKRPRRNTRP